MCFSYIEMKWAWLVCLCISSKVQWEQNYIIDTKFVIVIEFIATMFCHLCLSATYLGARPANLFQANRFSIICYGFALYVCVCLHIPCMFVFVECWVLRGGVGYFVFLWIEKELLRSKFLFLNIANFVQIMLCIIDSCIQ